MMRRLAILLPILLAACGGETASEPVPKEKECSVLVMGGSFGGVAAAIGAARRGADVWLVEDSDWVGGQVTSQGVSALDEHRHIEEFGGTRLYYEFRDRVRKRCGGKKNPGGGWVSRLCFEPKVGLAVLEAMLREHKVNLLIGWRPIYVNTVDRRVESVLVGKGQQRILFKVKVLIDATDLGEVMPLTGAEFYKFGEPDTKEPNAQPGKVQSYTTTFAVEHRPGENHVIEKPENYEELRDKQPFTLDHFYPPPRNRTRYGFFEKTPGTAGSFFDYRRISQDPPVAMINWPGNDYRGRDPYWKKMARKESKELSRAFLYWLQTECPRDDGGKGYPELMLRKDIMGTEDGFSMRPYIREGRRLAARTRITEMDLTGGRRWEDSVGIGWYPIDLHSCCEDKDDTGNRMIPTSPFQIPWGALVPAKIRNLLPGCKNIGTTHVANGAYRLHPVEWNIGESAGHAAAFCAEKGIDVGDAPIREIQRELLKNGVPLFWLIDIPLDHPDFETVQWLAVTATWPIEEGRLKFEPGALMNPIKAKAVWGEGYKPVEGETRVEFARRLLKHSKKD